MTQIDNRTLFTGDNLDVMRAMNSESVDLIYLDPPFNKNKMFVFPLGDSETSEKGDFGYKDIWGWDTPTNKNNPYLPYAEKRAFDELLVAAADGNPLLDRKPAKKAVRFLEAIGEFADDSQMSYLAFMAARLFEMKRILKPTGSIYLHCDPTMSHSLKLLMDIVFGADNFRNEIVWHYSKGNPPRNRFKPKTENIFFYVKGERAIFNQPRMPYTYVDPREFRFKDEAGRVYRENRVKDKDGNPKRFYLDDGTPMDNMWTFLRDRELNQINSNSPERTSYPTQKPAALLERIIKASSNEGDIVLDPFCGCATTCIAAERLGRHWIGIDVAKKAYEEVLKRLKQETKQGKFNLIKDGKKYVREEVPKVNYCNFNQEKCPIMRTDLGETRSRNIKQQLYQRQECRCRLCKTLFGDKRNLTIDHIIPTSKGGPDADRNLQLLCFACNSMKGDRTMEWATRRLRELMRTE